jgi:hypothetical protein
MSEDMAHRRSFFSGVTFAVTLPITGTMLLLTRRQWI